MVYINELNEKLEKYNLKRAIFDSTKDFRTKEADYLAAKKEQDKGMEM